MTSPALECSDIRQRIIARFRSAYSGALPLEWENMAPPEASLNGWLRFSISHDQVETVGLNPGRRLHRGRITLVIAVPSGQGTAQMDDLSGEIIRLLAEKDIDGIRTGAAVFTTPRHEPGLHLLSVQIRFTAFETDIDERSP